MSETQIYSKQYVGVLPKIFAKRASFANAFGELQVADGVRENAVAFSLKTINMPTVIGTYSTDANMAFGTGTANSSRFGERKEVIYANTDVPYNAPWAIHEGIDRYTVNADLTQAVADRLVEKAQALIARSNVADGAALVAAGKDIGVDSSDVAALFKTASNKYTQLEVTVPITAYVNATVYNAIVDSNLSTTAKNSVTNVDTNNVVMFKGFKIIEVPDSYMGGKSVIFSPDQVGRTFIGISTARTIESEDFDGVALQAAGKDGVYIPEANKPAILFASASK